MAMEELLSIGEFSALSGLSAKVLRTYAADGLLSPTAVDRESGYRYYSPALVERARMIGALRRAAVPLREIGEFLRDATPEQFDRWYSALEEEVAARRIALEEARSFLADEPERPPGHHPAMNKEDGAVMTFHAASASDRGPVRASNQDAVLVSETVVAVADGMGSGGRGEVASQVALDAVREFCRGGGGCDLHAAISAANEQLWGRIQEEPALDGAGTTVAALTVQAGGQGSQALIANVGDSRVYLLSDGGVRQLTRDHTIVADLLRTGELTELEAKDDPRRSMLTRVLGVSPKVDADVFAVELAAAGRLLLCTDGLHNELGDDHIAEILGGSADPATAADQLVHAAVEAGGRDNVSAVVVDVRE